MKKNEIIGLEADGSTESMRLRQKKEEEHEAWLSLIRDRLSSSAQSGPPASLDDVFKAIEQLHKKRMKKEG
jgi:antitoxin ParD1/3/4